MNIEVGSEVRIASPGRLYGYYGRVIAIVGNDITVSLGSFLGRHSFLKSELNVVIPMSIKPHNYPEW